MVMIAAGGRIVSGAADVGVVALEEWSSGAFSAYICWLNVGFNLTGSIVGKNIARGNNK